MTYNMGSLITRVTYVAPNNTVIMALQSNSIIGKMKHFWSMHWCTTGILKTSKIRSLQSSESYILQNKKFDYLFKSKLVKLSSSGFKTFYSIVSLLQFDEK